MTTTIQEALADLWDALDSTVFLVLDEDGVNMEDAVVRQAGDAVWLYGDDVDGFSLFGRRTYEGLRVQARVEPEEEEALV